jgi:hypothetical protein
MQGPYPAYGEHIAALIAGLLTIGGVSANNCGIEPVILN